jgi:hypothetical protein
MGSGEAPRSMGKEQKTEPTQAQNMAVWLTLLISLGAAAFALLGAVVAQRVAHAASWAGSRTREWPGEVPASRTSNRGATDLAEPLAELAHGVAQSATTAVQALSNGRITAGAVSMDAAMRAAEVGRDGGPAASRSAFERALHLVRDARTALQNGDVARAAATMGRVSNMLASIPANAAALLPETTRGYDGAQLLNAAGMMIGTVDHVSGASPGGIASATLVVGGYHQVLGFLDFGGSRLTMPTDRLVFGKVHAIGPTRVVFATMAQTPAEVRSSPP